MARRSKWSGGAIALVFDRGTVMNTEESVSLTFHGAGRTVTGSCMEVAYGERRLLIDCGLFQGSRSLEGLNHRAFAFRPREIDAVIVTHARSEEHTSELQSLIRNSYAF